jgi:hypothetical protein
LFGVRLNTGKIEFDWMGPLFTTARHWFKKLAGFSSRFFSASRLKMVEITYGCHCKISHGSKWRTLLLNGGQFDD